VIRGVVNYSVSPVSPSSGKVSFRTTITSIGSGPQPQPKTCVGWSSLSRQQQPASALGPNLAKSLAKQRRPGSSKSHQPEIRGSERGGRERERRERGRGLRRPTHSRRGPEVEEDGAKVREKPSLAKGQEKASLSPNRKTGPRPWYLPAEVHARVPFSGVMGT